MKNLEKGVSRLYGRKKRSLDVEYYYDKIPHEFKVQLGKPYDGFERVSKYVKDLVYFYLNTVLKNSEIYNDPYDDRLFLLFVRRNARKWIKRSFWRDVYARRRTVPKRMRERLNALKDARKAKEECDGHKVGGKKTLLND